MKSLTCARRRCKHFESMKKVPRAIVVVWLLQFDEVNHPLNAALRNPFEVCDCCNRHVLLRPIRPAVLDMQMPCKSTYLAFPNSSNPKGSCLPFDRAWMRCYMVASRPAASRSWSVPQASARRSCACS